jgi:hypothetical protein
MSEAEFKEDYIIKKFVNASWIELAEAPVTAIRGVSQQDAIDLKEAFNIKTIRDFAENEYVCLAQGIDSFSKASGEILEKKYTPEEFLKLRDQPVEAISGISKGDSALLKRAFGIETIADLAENRYILIAQIILTMASLERLLI